ncbi:MAG: hypothetical protein WEC33_07080 [Dehalococcoidia bacterium]
MASKLIERLRAAELALHEQAQLKQPHRAWTHPDLTPAEKQFWERYHAVEREYESALDAIHRPSGGGVLGLSDAVGVAHEMLGALARARKRNQSRAVRNQYLEQVWKWERTIQEHVNRAKAWEAPPALVAEADKLLTAAKACVASLTEHVDESVRGAASLELGERVESLRELIRVFRRRSPDLITQVEAANQAGVSEGTIRRWQREGRLGKFANGKVDRAELDRKLSVLLQRSHRPRAKKRP